MANEEIKQPSNDKSNAPANPAGDVLREDDLESASGGMMTTEGAMTLGCCTLTLTSQDSF